MIRKPTIADAPQLLRLMRKLAEFEGYADCFAVTESDLIERGLAPNSRDEFAAWVVDDNGVLQGYAVAYVIPFTFDLRPTLVLKELFVEDRMRGQGCGDALLTSVIQYGQSINARLLRWQVLPNNESAKHFYRSRGGGPDESWENWVLNVNSVAND